MGADAGVSVGGVGQRRRAVVILIGFMQLLVLEISVEIDVGERE